MFHLYHSSTLRKMYGFKTASPKDFHKRWLGNAPFLTLTKHKQKCFQLVALTV